MNDIVGWLAITVVAGLLMAVGSLIDWKSALSTYWGDTEDDDDGQR